LLGLTHGIGISNSMTNISRTLTVVEDPDNPGELLLDLGAELCAELGWQVGDTLEWIDNKDGTWLLSNPRKSMISQL
jgi:DNA-binding Xre family transcriptional regulator